MLEYLGGPCGKNTDFMALDKSNVSCAALCRDVRTSQGTFVSRDEDQDGVLAWVEEKTAQITGIPSGHGEVAAFCCRHLCPG